MELEEARRLIGQKVVYRAPHITPRMAGEEGVITSVGDPYVFVRYGSDYGSKATPVDCLEPMS